MGCLHYPRKQTSVGYAADCDVIAHAAGVVAARDQRGDMAGAAARVDADPAVRDRAGRSRALSKLPPAAVGWVEPLRNPSPVAVAVMGFASTFAVLQFADEIAQPILRTSRLSCRQTP